MKQVCDSAIFYLYTCAKVCNYFVYLVFLYTNHVHGNLIEPSYDDSESSGINKPESGCPKLTMSLVNIS